MHGRTLIDFFHFPPSRADDLDCEMVAVPRRTMPTSGPLYEWKTSADKYLAHLTKKRFTEPTAWKKAKDVRTALEQCFVDLEAAVGSELPGDWIGRRSTATIEMAVQHAAALDKPTTTVRSSVTGTEVQ
jgi:hypothetical protein